MAYYKLIAFAFIALVVLPNSLTMADDGPFDDDHDDVPGVPDDDHDDDDGPPITNPPVTPTPATPTQPPATPTTPPSVPTTPPATPTTPPSVPTTPPAIPTLPPPTGDVCAQVDCGQGRCVLNSTAIFGYKCACQTGWRRTIRGYDDDDLNDHDDDLNDRDDDPNDHDDHDDDDDIGYLPCLVPDCNMNFTCQGSTLPPMPPKQPPANNSVFDPCYWANCGQGTCMKSPESDYKHICQCNPGFNNLMNISYFPCYSNCVIGDDCAKIGVNKTAPGVGNDRNKGLADGINTDNGSQALLPRNFYWVGTLMAMALALWH